MIINGLIANSTQCSDMLHVILINPNFELKFGLLFNIQTLIGR